MNNVLTLDQYKGWVSDLASAEARFDAAPETQRSAQSEVVARPPATPDDAADARVPISFRRPRMIRPESMVAAVVEVPPESRFAPVGDSSAPEPPRQGTSSLHDDAWRAYFEPDVASHNDGDKRRDGDR